jgi:hypothetical protein
MVRACIAALEELIANRLWEREVGEPVAVKVAELDPAQPELDPAEAVRCGGDPRPAQDLFGNAVLCAVHSDIHNSYPSGHISGIQKGTEAAKGARFVEKPGQSGG